MSSIDRTTPEPQDRRTQGGRDDGQVVREDDRTRPLPEQPVRETDRTRPATERGAFEDDAYAGSGAAAVPNRHDVVAAQKERFGGIKIGSAFFGWLTAMGMTVLLTALLAAAGTAFGVASGTTVDQATSDATSDPKTVGLIGIIALLVVLVVAYYCGGYVAGRMARFDGAKQGVGVWLWALVVAILVAVLGVVAGNKYNVLANLNGFPRLPIGEGDLTTAGIIAAVVAAAAALAGAILGGLAGMRYHRRVDRAGLGD
jgi:hypothetical protein